MHRTTRHRLCFSACALADLIVQAKSGTGKTVAFCLGLLQRVVEEVEKCQRDVALESEVSSPRIRHSSSSSPSAAAPSSPEFPSGGVPGASPRSAGSACADAGSRTRNAAVGFGLVVTPTRELAVQIANEMGRLAWCLRPIVRVACLFGGRPLSVCQQQLRVKPHVLVTTPGRLLSLLRNKGTQKVLAGWPCTCSTARGPPPREPPRGAEDGEERGEDAAKATAEDAGEDAGERRDGAPDEETGGDKEQSGGGEERGAEIQRDSSVEESPVESWRESEKSQDLKLAENSQESRREAMATEKTEDEPSSPPDERAKTAAPGETEISCSREEGKKAKKKRNEETRFCRTCRRLSAAARLKRQMRMFVLDEADLLLDHFFRPQIRSLLTSLLVRRTQLLAFSATFPSPLLSFLEDLVESLDARSIAAQRERLAKSSSESQRQRALAFVAAHAEARRRGENARAVVEGFLAGSRGGGRVEGEEGVRAERRTEAEVAFLSGEAQSEVERGLPSENDGELEGVMEISGSGAQQEARATDDESEADQEGEDAPEVRTESSSRKREANAVERETQTPPEDGTKPADANETTDAQDCLCEPRVFQKILLCSSRIVHEPKSAAAPLGGTRSRTAAEAAQAIAAALAEKRSSGDSSETDAENEAEDAAPGEREGEGDSRRDREEGERRWAVGVGREMATEERDAGRGADRLEEEKRRDAESRGHAEIREKMKEEQKRQLVVEGGDGGEWRGQEESGAKNSDNPGETERSLTNGCKSKNSVFVGGDQKRQTGTDETEGHASLLVETTAASESRDEVGEKTKAANTTTSSGREPNNFCHEANGRQSPGRSPSASSAFSSAAQTESKRSSLHLSGGLAKPRVPSPLLVGLHYALLVVPDQPTVLRELGAKVQVLLRVLATLPFRQAVVFCNSFDSGAQVANCLNQLGVAALYTSARLRQEDRVRALLSLKRVGCRVLVCSDVISRGIDAAGVDLTVNVDLPMDSQTFLHRSGRAGRFGGNGFCVSISTENERPCWEYLAASFKISLHTSLESLEALARQQALAHGVGDEDDAEREEAPPSPPKSSGAVASQIREEPTTACSGRPRENSESFGDVQKAERTLELPVQASAGAPSPGRDLAESVREAPETQSCLASSPSPQRGEATSTKALDSPSSAGAASPPGCPSSVSSSASVAFSSPSSPSVSPSSTCLRPDSTPSGRLHGSRDASPQSSHTHAWAARPPPQEAPVSQSSQNESWSGQRDQRRDVPGDTTVCPDSLMKKSAMVSTGSAPADALSSPLHSVAQRSVSSLTDSSRQASSTRRDVSMSAHAEDETEGRSFRHVVLLSVPLLGYCVNETSVLGSLPSPLSPIPPPYASSSPHVRASSPSSSAASSSSVVASCASPPPAGVKSSMFPCWFLNVEKRAASKADLTDDLTAAVRDEAVLCAAPPQLAWTIACAFPDGANMTEVTLHEREVVYVAFPSRLCQQAPLAVESIAAHSDLSPALPSRRSSPLAAVLFPDARMHAGGARAPGGGAGREEDGSSRCSRKAERKGETRGEGERVEGVELVEVMLTKGSASKFSALVGLSTQAVWQDSGAVYDPPEATAFLPSDRDAQKTRREMAEDRGEKRSEQAEGGAKEVLRQATDSEERRESDLMDRDTAKACKERAEQGEPVERGEGSELLVLAMRAADAETFFQICFEHFTAKSSAKRLEKESNPPHTAHPVFFPSVASAHSFSSPASCTVSRTPAELCSASLREERAEKKSEAYLVSSSSPGSLSLPNHGRSAMDIREEETKSDKRYQGNVSASIDAEAMFALFRLGCAALERESRLFAQTHFQKAEEERETASSVAESETDPQCMRGRNESIRESIREMKSLHALLWSTCTYTQRGKATCTEERRRREG
ncbi:DEAD/DEAH box helicase domain protein [Toxoplasma gondii GAB2-2007-GAL-DOM2]|uniref:ATP-dependent RNA helicase n=2 Tax=Toxoplasma gondii TaxID=5811 RepID=A0A086JKS6_TOXGO|nr:DEAD/DEAH box helicase domain protein [Toxoplasma gondii GAB2-2007-GAL-DOM2]KFG32744.1 DEAD/DEAH box helicase domain-containing protein [Toxoplasma gondii FOU]